MEYYTFSIFLLSIIFTILFFTKLVKKSELPPGPKPWPIIGNIHQLGNKPHRALAKLSKTYGPIMSLKLGCNTTIVISSSEIVKEMFLNHDLAFSGRPVFNAAQAINHDKLSMVFLPVCPQWRNLRKIATIQLFTSQRLDASQGLREQKVKELIEYVQKCSETGASVDIGKAAFTTTLNLLSNTCFSMDLDSYGSTYSQEFKELVWNVMEEVGRPNVSDFFPLVKHLDLQGVRRRTTSYFKKLLGIFEKIIEERLKDPMDVKDDVLGTLLKLVKDEELSLDYVKHMLMDLFIAGTETTSSTLEWVMTELLRNPEKIVMAQIRMDQVLGKDCQLQESYIVKLPYIQAIVKETMRLHPPAPFLIPHKAVKDIQLYNYLIPKHSTIWVNAWAIGRDPKLWSKSESFLPERFLEREIDMKGRNFELIPFGSGRRICPGMPLAYRMVHLMLSALLRSFNWKYAHGASPKDIDVEEKFGLSMQKIDPLQAIPFPR